MFKEKVKREYVIVTDTACDLSADMLDSLGITALPMHVIIDDKDYLHYADFRNLSKNEFYEAISGDTDVTTSQVDLSATENTLRRILESGKDILCIAFSSGLSGTYSGIKMISEELAEEFPDSTMYIIDSLCASGGEGLLVYTAAEKKASGMDIHELAEWVEDNKLKIGHWFTVDNLNQLRKGGRISNTASFVGNLLNIKPILYMDGDGHLAPNSKCTGRNKALSALVEKMSKHTKGKKFDNVFISQAECMDAAEILKEKLKEEFKIEKITILDIDPIIAAHTGAGCIALFFFSNKDRE